MSAIRIFDPATCCSTGVCGPSVDPRIVRFAADLDWLRTQGVSIDRTARAGAGALRSLLATHLKLMMILR